MPHLAIHLLFFLCELTCVGTSSDSSEISIFREYCPGVKTCTDRESETRNNSIEEPSCCQTCTCDIHCWDRGNCCPDVPYPYRSNTVQCDRKKSFFDYFVVDRCAEGHNSIESMICQSDDDPRLLEDAVLVSDVNNSRVFRNRFCAECNGVMNYVPWKVASLDEFSYDVCTNGKNALLFNVSRLEDCKFISVRPNEEIHNNAICQINTIIMISDCPQSDNVTLQWYHERCEKYRIPAFFNNLVNNESRLYKNVFCFVCKALREGINPEPYKVCDSGITGQLGGTRYQAILPFRKIFSLADDVDSSIPAVCEKELLFDEFENRCLEYSCAFGHVKQDGRCVRNIIETYNAEFSIQIEFIPVYKHAGISTSTAARIYTKAAKQLITSIRQCPFGNERAWTLEDEEWKGSFLWETVIFTTYNCQDRDVKYIVDYLRNNEVVVIDEEFSTSTFFFVKPVSLNVPVNITKTNLNIDFNEVTSTSPTFELTAVTFCTAILLSENMLNGLQDDISKNPDKQGDLQNELSKYLVKEDDVYKLCYDTYAYVRRELKSSTFIRTPGSIGGYLSLVCTMVSLICAGFTVVVNLIFDRSRRLPQYILHVVCINLILAQAMFQFGIGAEISGFPCTLMGILIHFLWLAHAFAMSAFVFGVVLTVRKIRTRSSLSSLRIAVHALYIYGVPLMFVTLNIVVSKLTTDNDDVGYGEGPERLCYISTVFSRLVFFVVPLFVVVGLNMICYIYFFWFMVNHRMESVVLQTQKSHIQAFARLSCVTGIAWVFGLMTEFSDFAVFEYLFIVTNCGQGVFLFIAFGKIKNIYQRMKARILFSTSSIGE